MNRQRQSNPTDASGLAFRTANDLPAETRGPVVQQLNQSLADASDMQSQMKFAHWNVKGMNFYQLHLLFDEIAEMLAEHVDMLAERATALGGQAMGTVRMAAGTSQIPELSPSTVSGPKFVEETTEHLAAHGASLRSAIEFAAEYGDEDTADLYTEISRDVDKHVYFLESHLQARTARETSGARTTGDTHQPEWTVRDSQSASQGQQSAMQGQQSQQGHRQQGPPPQ